MSEPAGWTYVDDRRTHELRVSIERGKARELVVRERVFGSDEPDDVYVERHVLHDAWDQKLLLLKLETRLTLLGNYHRHEAGSLAWAPVRIAQAGPAPDLAPLEMEGESGALELHHFTSEDRHAVSLVAVHQDTPKGRRSLLVRLDYEFPDTEGGHLDVVHARLAPPLYRSALASLHMSLADKRFRKTPRDQKRMADPRSWAAMRAALDAILVRLVESAAAKADTLRDATGKPLDARSLILVNQATRTIQGAASKERSYQVDFEIDGAAAGVEGPKPEVLMEELPADVFGALKEPRLLALHERFLKAGDERALFGRGERAIHLAMRDLRGNVRPDEQHLVSLLEASLLLRYALEKRIPVDPDVIKRVKHARAYL